MQMRRPRCNGGGIRSDLRGATLAADGGSRPGERGRPMMMRRARPCGTAFSVAARREVDMPLDIKLSIGAPCSIRRLGRSGPRGSAPLRRTILAGRTGPAGIGDHGRSRYPTQKGARRRLRNTSANEVRLKLFDFYKCKLTRVSKFLFTLMVF
jgi:hypothetical protein